jgi:hypothetical protein
MKVLDSGHLYELDQYDAPLSVVILLPFMKRVGEGYPGNEAPARGGTNCQEVLRALIDRVKYLDGQDHSGENYMILHHLRQALLGFEERAAHRKGNTFTEFYSDKPELVPYCSKCGHMKPGCDHEFV